MQSLRVLLVAEEAAGLRALELVAASPHTLVAACTSGTGEAGGSSVAGRAKGLDVPLRPAELVAEESFAAQVRAEEIDLLLNVHSLRIAHPAVIAAPRLGAYNLHPGPLPEYAGLSVPSWAIYNGERSHAVTLHEMDAEVDAGSVAFEESLRDRRGRHRPDGERGRHPSRRAADRGAAERRGRRRGALA